jgi:hypothetical protein
VSVSKVTPRVTTEGQGCGGGEGRKGRRGNCATQGVDDKMLDGGYE